MQQTLDINQLAHEIYTYNVIKGWWDNGQDCPFQKLLLVDSEVSEAVEGIRKGLMDDHLEHRPMGEVELADALIRIMDLSGFMGWVYLADSTKYYEVRNRIFTCDWTEGRRIESAKRVLGYLATAVERDNDKDRQNEYYSEFIYGMYALAEYFDYDIEGAIEEKQSYNTVRKDHTKEVRQSAGGKRW